MSGLIGNARRRIENPGPTEQLIADVQAIAEGRELPNGYVVGNPVVIEWARSYFTGASDSKDA